MQNACLGQLLAGEGRAVGACRRQMPVTQSRKHQGLHKMANNPERILEDSREGRKSRKTGSSDGNGESVGPEWCSCGSCKEMPTSIERVCCRTYRQMRHLLRHEQKGCVTDLPRFKSKCLKEYRLENAIDKFLGYNTERGGKVQHRRILRYVSYRRLTRWAFGYLRKDQRVVLPACCVSRIRNKFPAENYRGFVPSKK